MSRKRILSNAVVLMALMVSPFPVQTVAAPPSTWADGTRPNYGLMLILPGQAGDRYLSSEYSDVDRRPWLEVCYIAP